VNSIRRRRRRRGTFGEDVDVVRELIEVVVAGAWMAVVAHPAAVLPGDQTHS
jgi:hypothetical protein